MQLEKLNNYLQQLLSACGHALHLEPNKNPYILTSRGSSEIATTPLPGSQINAMIFSLLPPDVKQELPNQNEVEFVHPHTLGKFTFLVRKSPSGFIVTVSPLDLNSSNSTGFNSNPGTSEMKQVPQNPENPVLSLTTEENVWEPDNDSEDEEFVIETIPNLEDFRFEQDDLKVETDPPVETFRTNSYQPPPSSVQVEFEEAGSDPDPAPAPDLTPAETKTEVQPEWQADFAPETVTFESGDEVQINDFNPAVTDSFEVNNMKPQSTPFNPNPNSPPVQPAVPPVPQANMPTPPVTNPAPPVQHPTSSMSSASVENTSQMDALFRKMAEMGASDLHLSVSMPPMVRKDGKMRNLGEGQPPLTPEAMKKLLTSIMPQKNIEEFERRNDTDFAYEIKGLARFRANIFMDRKGMGGVFRIIPSDIMTAEDLKLSKHILDLCDLSKGLVVVTGPTGSGKSTTLCAMIDYINRNREDHIITIEDPIEFTHENQKCLVNQREVHNHTDSFKDALRAALREDPDILLVGEMRDLETISIAIETAETGHLVFGTLHTTTAASTVDRIIDQFPADRQQQVRVMLSESLRGVIAQTLLPKKGGGRVAALEVLIVTPAISNLIREGKTFQIPSAMQTGKNKGMVMLNDALMELVQKGMVEPKDAYIKAVDKTGFEMLLSRNGMRI